MPEFKEVDLTTALPVKVDPPRDEAELRARLSKLGGRSLGALAEAQGIEAPIDLRRDKGWVGMLLERALGASAGSRAEPDFPHLGIELKTIPIDREGRPLESTFVASLDLAERGIPWERSPVRKKLARVALVVIEAAKEIPLAQRRCGASLIWSPAPEEEAMLRRDYEEIVELIEEGFLERVTGHRGSALQLRPKGRNAADLRSALDEEGQAVRAPPRAFYLRSAFTESILRRHFQMPASTGSSSSS
jgi:DNA mismatch repair protein MutH